LNLVLDSVACNLCVRTQLSETAHMHKFTAHRHIMVYQRINLLHTRGVRSLKILTPTPLLLWLNVRRLRSDTF